DLPVPGEPAPPRPGWKGTGGKPPAAEAGPPAKPPSGTINFDAIGPPPPAAPPERATTEVGAPTPWLPFPEPRVVTPPPAAAPPAGEPPPGLSATTVVPDIEPVAAPDAPPAAGPGGRDTSPPWSPV